SSSDQNYSYIPKDFNVPLAAAYFHYTSTNTICWTEVFVTTPGNVPTVVDMSSDIFSREIDVREYDLIYAGAQKNMGPAGVTLVIVRDEILGKSGRTLPTIFDYESHVKAASLYNTPPVFS